jgi:hypothetical protein
MTAVNFSAESDGISSFSAPSMFLTGGVGPTYQNWCVNMNQNAAGLALQHLASSTWSVVGYFTIAELSGLRDAMNQQDYGTSACKYAPYWELLTDTADGTDLIHSSNQGSSYTTLLAGLAADRFALQVFLNRMGLP